MMGAGDICRGFSAFTGQLGFFVGQVELTPLDQTAEQLKHYQKSAVVKVKTQRTIMTLKATKCNF